MRVLVLAPISGLAEALAAYDLQVVSAEEKPLVTVVGGFEADVVWRERRAGRGVVVLGTEDEVVEALDAGLEGAIAPASPPVVAALVRAAERRRFVPHYERLLDQIAESVEISNVEAELGRVNQPFERYSGYEASYAVGRTPMQLFRTGHQDSRHFAEVNAAVHQGAVWAGEIVDRRRDGSLCIVHTTVSGVFQCGERVGYLVTKVEQGRDLGADSGAEQRMRLLVEEAADAVFVVTPDGRLAEVNRSACRMLGIERAALMQHNLFPLLGGRTSEAWRELMAEAKPGEARTVTCSMRNPDGRVVPVELRLTQISVAMESLILILARDITERERAERELQELNRRLSELNTSLEDQVRERTRMLDEAVQRLGVVLRHAVDGLVGVRADGMITVANPAFWTLLGGRVVERLDLLGNPELVDVIRRCLTTGSLQQADVRLGERTAAVVVSPVTRGPSVIGSVALVRDVTREREVDRMKTDFIATVSHELRTPLTSVLGFAKLTKRRFESRVVPHVDDASERTRSAIASVSHNLEVITSEGERLTLLINDVLDIAKMEAGRLELALELLDLGEVVEKTVLATAVLFDDPRTVLRSESTSVMVRGDVARLVQVAINLVANAHKFTDDGEVRLWTGTEHGRAFLRVSDTGIGIPRPSQAQIFERFHQLGDALTDKPVGTGLGLAICRQLVRAHGGTITVESRVGEGSTFTVRLPLAVESGSS